MAGTCAQTADRLADQGIGVTVVDPRWVKPLDEALVAEAARGHRLVVTVEDNGRVAAGSATRWPGCCATTTSRPRSGRSGSPQEFLEHGERSELLEDLGLAPQQLARVDHRDGRALRRTTPSWSRAAARPELTHGARA